MAELERITLITGATRGIGRACAERLAEEGHTIIGLARSNSDVNFPGYLYAADLKDRQDTANVLANIEAKHNINGVVNNVGLTSHQPIEKYDLGTFDDEIQVNLTCTVQTVKACAPNMKRIGFGRIVNISTELILGHFNRTGYTAAKAGLHALNRTWSYELAPHGITVNSVAPGPVATEMFAQKNPVGSKQREAKLARIPAGRIGRPEDIAGAVSFFMANETSWVTGQNLFVDGGSSLGGAGLL